MPTCDHETLSQIPEVTSIAPIQTPSEGEARIIIDGDTDDEEVPRLSRIHCEAAPLLRAEATPLLNNTYSQLGSDGNLRRRCGRICGNTFCGWDFDRMKPMSKDDIDPLGLFLSVITALAFGFCGYITYLYFIEKTQNTVYNPSYPYNGELPTDGLGQSTEVSCEALITYKYTHKLTSRSETFVDVQDEAVHLASAAASAAVGAGHHAVRHALRRQ